MEIYLKSIGGVFIALMLCLALGNRGKEFTVLLALTACAMVMIAGLTYFSAVLDFFGQLQSLIGLDNDLLTVLLKAVGVGLIGEIAGLICTDAGQASLSKAVQILTTAIILWISLPLYSQILKLVEELLSGL